MATTTPNLSLNKGSHGDWLNYWEIPINQNWDIMDALFDGTTGHGHSGAAGDGPQLDHTTLTNIGTLTHLQLEASLPKVKVSSADTTEDYLESKIQAGTNVTITKINPGANEYLQVSSTGGGSPWTDADEYGDKHTTPTSAPVAYTDNFNWPMGFILRNADYMVDSSPVTLNFLSTGYSASIFVDTNTGDPLTGAYASTVKCQIPHSPAQRATLSITEVDFDELFVGDAICFTLAVYSTHTLGTSMPQKYGVFLEIHVTCTGTGPNTYQVSHRVVVIPDDVTRVEFPACVHTDVDDFLGCWELSLDQNGHVYVYWRRTPVFTTQTSPVSIPGPVQTYFSTLSASLVALGEPVYGAIGFGIKYAVSLESMFNVEVRWLSITGTDDLYHETFACSVPPLVLPEVPEFPEEFLKDPAGDGMTGTPGSECCTSPSTVETGEVLAYDGATPEVWVMTCGEYGSGLPGYLTNVSTVVTPCAYMTAPSTTFSVTSGAWEEAASGTALLQGVSPLPPSLSVTPSAGLTITDANWVDYDTVLLHFTLDDGIGGTTPSIDIYDQYRPANTINVVLPAVAEIDIVVTTEEYTDGYYLGDVVAGLHEGRLTNYRMTGAGFNPTVNVATTVPGAVVTVTYVNPGEVTGTVTVPMDAGVTIVPLSFSNSITGAPFTVVNAPVLDAAPLVYYIEATSNTPSVATTASVYGNFFSPTISATCTTGNFTGIAVTWVSQTQLTITGTVGTIPADIELRLQNPSGAFTDIPFMRISAPAPTFLGLTPGSVMEGVQKQNQDIQISAAFDSTWVMPSAGLATPSGAPYASPGNMHISDRSSLPASIELETDPDCGDGGNSVTLWVSNPGVAPVLVSGSMSVDSSLVPSGLALTVTSAPPGSNLIGVQITGTNITAFSDVTGNAYVVPSSVVGAAGVVTFDLAVASNAPEGSTQNLTVVNPCGNTAPIGFDIEYIPPTLTSVLCGRPEAARQNVPLTLHGTNILSGGALTVTGQATLDSFLWVDSETVTAVADFLLVGTATFRWTNPDGNFDEIGLPVTAEQAPQVYHTSVNDPVVGATNQDLYIYGAYLDPLGVGMSIALTNASLVSTVTWTSTFIHLKVDITGAATNDITAQITGTITYPSFYVETIEAAGTGPVTVTTVTTVPDPAMEAASASITVEGTNLMQVDTIEVWSTFPERSNLLYIPWGVTPPGTFTIVSQNDTKIEGTLALGASLYPWSLDLKLYDIIPTLLLTVVGAVSPDYYQGPPNNAPVVTNVVIYDTINETSGLPQAVIFDMLTAPTGGETWTGDNISALTPTITGPQQWTVAFTITAPGPYALYCYRSAPPPASPDYNVVRGVTGVAV